MGTPTTTTSVPKFTRRRGACLYCKQKKVKCDGKRPCKHCACQKHNTVCGYPFSVDKDASHKSASNRCYRGPRHDSERITSVAPSLNPPDSAISMLTPMDSWDKQDKIRDRSSPRFDLERSQVPEVQQETGVDDCPVESALDPLSLPFSLDDWEGQGFDGGKRVGDHSKDIPFSESLKDASYTLLSPETLLDSSLFGSLHPSPSLCWNDDADQSTAFQSPHCMSQPSRPDSASVCHLPVSKVPKKIPTPASTPRSAGEALARARAVSSVLMSREYQLYKIDPSRTCHVGSRSLQMLLDENGGMEQCRVDFEASMAIIDGPSLLLDPDLLQGLYRNQTDDPPYILAALMLWGKRLRLSTKHSNEVADWESSVVVLKNALYSGGEGIDKFLAFVITVQLAHAMNLEFLQSLIANAYNLLQLLHLHRAEGLEKATSTRSQRDMVQRAICVLFSVDRINAMRWRIYPFIPESIAPTQITDADPNPVRSDQVLGSVVRYACICGRINDALLRTGGTQRGSTPSQLEASLRTWYASGPTLAELGRASDASFEQRQYTFARLLQLQEAAMLLQDIPCTRTAGLENCREVLEVVGDFAGGLVGHSTYLYVPLKAFCRVAMEALQADCAAPTPSSADTITSIGMGFGHMSRFAADLPVPDTIELLAELVTLVLCRVQETAGSVQHGESSRAPLSLLV